jgi:hypothetical protein
MPALRLHIALYFFVLSLNTVGLAQENTSAIGELTLLQKEFSTLANTVLTAPSNEERKQASKKLQQALTEVFDLPEAFVYPFDSLTQVSRLFSSNGEVRLFSWTIPEIDGNAYHYAGVLCRRHPKTKEVTTYVLQDSSAKMVNVTTSQLTPDNWYGALYYDIITVKHKKNVYYTLLGWKGNNTVTTKKVIDVIQFTDGGPVFGAPVFEDNQQRQKKLRQVYEFSAEVSMSIHYESDKKVIVLDHLFPSQPSLEGYFEFYGPDLSFDAYALTKGKWEFIEDYDPGIRPPEEAPSLKKENTLYRSGN